MIRKGTWVRLRKKHRKGPWERDQVAKVLSTSLTSGNRRITGGLYLSRRLQGFRHWNILDVERATKPKFIQDNERSRR